MQGNQLTKTPAQIYETPVQNEVSSSIFDNPEYGMVAGQYEAPNNQNIQAHVWR